MKAALFSVLCEIKEKTGKSHIYFCILITRLPDEYTDTLTGTIVPNILTVCTD